MIETSDKVQKLGCAIRVRSSRLQASHQHGSRLRSETILTDKSTLLVFGSLHLGWSVGSRGQCLCSHAFVVTFRIG
jgi:hypothetical protein